VAAFSGIEALAVEHSTNPAIGDMIIERLKDIFPREKIQRSVISPVIGAYAGPNAFAVTVLEAEKK
jgi:fatty acid-binding protein DegV